jgi:hypothetical protein
VNPRGRGLIHFPATSSGFATSLNEFLTSASVGNSPGARGGWYGNCGSSGGVIPSIFNSIQAGGFRSLQEGQQVQFDVTKGPKGWQAENVTAV